ncbi:hypothetical protein GCM10011499_13930 [Pelagibacterium lentulum]|uniref:Uncharacterized protein n=1 Tax=Pelagibacterium lentulum TaxID=2029865 RepID=A0A916VWK4_9HYPH|nr:hypothetical protein GCM10011499_13930 [Pelagibacterium lentulum]
MRTGDGPDQTFVGCVMSEKLSTQKFVSMTIAALAGTAMCGLFAMVLLATGALAA